MTAGDPESQRRRESCLNVNRRSRADLVVFVSVRRANDWVVDANSLQDLWMPPRYFQEFRHNPSQESNLIANTLKRNYVDGLRLLYSAERQLKNVLPQMARAASAEGLRAWLRRRLEQAKEHVAILEELCTAIPESPRGEKCTQTEHFLAEGVKVMGKQLASEKLDRELIAIAQSIEDQQIAGLGWVDAHARPFEDDRASTGLKKMIEEEKARAKELARLSETIEVRAAGLAQMDGADGAWRGRQLGMSKGSGARCDPNTKSHMAGDVS